MIVCFQKISRPLPWRELEILEEPGGGGGGSMGQEIPKGRGVSRPNSLPDGWEND